MVPGWVLWNLALAVLPLPLAWRLFAPGRRPSRRWWLGVAVFVALLPNAPYVLTDVVHVPDAMQRHGDGLYVALVLLPGFAVFAAVGFVSYVLCIARVERWLRAAGWSLPRLLGADVTLHALCAVGIFLGRVFRFNSWDLLVRPHDVASVVRVPQPRSVVLLTATFLVLAVGTVAVRYTAGIRVRQPPSH